MTPKKKPKPVKKPKPAALPKREPGASGHQPKPPPKKDGDT